MKLYLLLPLSVALLAGCASRSGQNVAATQSGGLQPVAIGPGGQPAALGTAQQSVTLLPNQRNAFVPLKQTGTVTVALEANEQAGYSWKLAKPLDEKVVQLVSGGNQSPPPIALPPHSAAGLKPVPQQWVFKGVGPGTAKVRMIYSHRNEPISEVSSYEFTVNVE